MIRKLLAGVLAGAAIVIGPATAAFAHVTVDPATALQGSEITLGFRVPNEEPNAGTTQVQIFFPRDHPVLGVDPQSAPGWRDTVHNASLDPPIRTDDGLLTSYVSEVDWTGGPIQPGHFEEFFVLAQSLPTGTDQVVFKAVQTYSDGKVVRWIETASKDNPDPADPAPILKLTTTASGAGRGGAVTPGSVSTARTLAIVGLVAGALGLAGAAWAVVMARRARRPSR
jgi:uncharacterized protein YcnI